MHLLLEWFKSCCKDHFFPRTFTVILIHCRLYEKQTKRKKQKRKKKEKSKLPREQALDSLCKMVVKLD